MTDWISVQDQMPTDNDGFDDDKLVVIEFMPSGKKIVEIKHFSQWSPKSMIKGYLPVSQTEKGEFRKITHWMPLPKFP